MPNMTKSGGKMSAVAERIDPKRYAELLARTLPTVVETEEQNEQLLQHISGLLGKGNGLSAEERELLRLMVLLVENFENRHYSLKAATPNERLRELMQARGLAPHDLWPIFGSKGVASEVLNSKRAISKANARALAKFFNVSAELFL
jgi:HTH-type transcriptional regulator/antitoxin HigA